MSQRELELSCQPGVTTSSQLPGAFPSQDGVGRTPASTGGSTLPEVAQAALKTGLDF